MCQILCPLSFGDRGSMIWFQYSRNLYVVQETDKIEQNKAHVLTKEQNQ